MLEGLIRSFFKTGALAVRLPDGRIVCVGGVTPDTAPVVVRIRNTKTAARILCNPSLGVGEGYMDGGFVVERGSLYDFVEIATANLTAYRKRKARFAWRRRRGNGKREARGNVAHHYDLSGEFFRLFLDEDRQYSCAYFPRPGMSLEEAQAAKKRHIAAKLLLSSGQRVLDIGCGWGGLAITLAQEHGVHVTGITLSEEQFAEARHRAALRGLRREASFHLRDYRDVHGVFDRIVSVGMLEHVGVRDFGAYFGAIARLLTEDGVALVHTIGKSDGAGPNNPWIEKYIFPGGQIPALSEVAPAIERAGLVLTDLEVLRLHYAETLRAWRERFEAHREEVAELYDERFCRMWEFYLCGSEAGFRVGDLVVFQLQLAKRAAAVPLTRDYITDFDRAAGHAPNAIAAE